MKPKKKLTPYEKNRAFFKDPVNKAILNVLKIFRAMECPSYELEQQCVAAVNGIVTANMTREDRKIMRAFDRITAENIHHLTASGRV